MTSDVKLDKLIETPSSRWKSKGEPDPHGNRYDCERAKLYGGHLTDDEVANELFMAASSGQLNIATVAKDRIRWLSRQLERLLPVDAGTHVLVPVEPTNDMVDAGLEEDTWSPVEIYRAMIKEQNK